MVSPVTGKWQIAWITGASSGIGKAVALELAGAGVKVAASARSVDALKALATENPLIKAYPCDVTDSAAMATAASQIAAELGPIDLVILNAGTWFPVDLKNFDPAMFQKTFDVNFLGVVRGIAAVLPGMRERRRGQIAIVASVAGYRGLPKAGAYGPSKAALINLAESLRPDLADLGITLSLVNPGFVATPMTAVNDFPMPFMIETNDAARRIVKGLASGRFEVAFPWQLVSILKIARVLPYWLYFWLLNLGVRRR